MPRTTRRVPPQPRRVLTHNSSTSWTRHPFQPRTIIARNAAGSDDEGDTSGDLWGPHPDNDTWFGGPSVDPRPINTSRHSDLSNLPDHQYHQSYWPDRLRQIPSTFSNTSGSSDKPPGPLPQTYSHNQTQRTSTSEGELRTWIADLVSEHQSTGDPQNGTLVHLSTPRRIAISLEGGEVSCDCAYTDASSHRRSSRGDCCVQLREIDAIDQAREASVSHRVSSTGWNDVADIAQMSTNQPIWCRQDEPLASSFLRPLMKGAGSSSTSFETVPDEEHRVWHGFSVSDATSPGPNPPVEPDASVIELVNTPTCSDYPSELIWEGGEDAKSIATDAECVPLDTQTTPSSSSALYIQGPYAIMALALALIAISSSVLYATRHAWTPTPDALVYSRFDNMVPSPPVTLHSSSDVPPMVSFTTSATPSTGLQKGRHVNITVAHPVVGGKGVHIIVVFDSEGSVRVEIDTRGPV